MQRLGGHQGGRHEVVWAHPIHRLTPRVDQAVCTLGLNALPGESLPHEVQSRDERPRHTLLAPSAVSKVTSLRADAHTRNG